MHNLWITNLVPPHPSHKQGPNRSNQPQTWPNYNLTTYQLPPIWTLPEKDKPEPDQQEPEPEQQEPEQEQHEPEPDYNAMTCAIVKSMCALLQRK